MHFISNEIRPTIIFFINIERKKIDLNNIKVKQCKKNILIFK